MDVHRLRWAEYAIEGGLLGTFMIAACLAVAVFEHPHSPVRRRLPNPVVRRAFIGAFMGLTAIGLIYSAAGQCSGAHMNPGTTLTFLLLGKVHPIDAVFYVLAQFAGGIAGVSIARVILRKKVSHERVRFASTLPGSRGKRIAWLAEFSIAFLMMSMVLWSTNSSSTAPFTGIFAGIMVAAFIAIEAPLSGMSMNPARTLGSALHSSAFDGLWIYFTAPPLAMLGAALLYSTIRGDARVYCAKLHHPHEMAHMCIFNCRIEQMRGWDSSQAPRLGIGSLPTR